MPNWSPYLDVLTNEQSSRIFGPGPEPARIENPSHKYWSPREHNEANPYGGGYPHKPIYRPYPGEGSWERKHEQTV